MKRNLHALFTAAMLTVLTPAGFAQSQAPRDKALYPAGNNTTSAINIRSASSVSCDSLVTTFAAGNGQDGIMFNIQAVQTSVITGFHIVCGEPAGTSGYIKYYYRQGTYLGNETTSSAWTFIDSVQVTSAGSGIPFYVPINTSIRIPAGSKYGFYITGNGGGVSLDYTNGTNQDSIYVSNAYIQVREGRGMGYPFTTSGVPRVFNGIVHYCPENDMMCDTVRTTYAAGNGHSGVMFDVTALQPVVIHKFFTNVSADGFFKIYYRNGTYVGNETTPGAWTFLDSCYVHAAPTGFPTMMNIDVNVPVALAQTVAFYVTGTSESGAAVHYTDGSMEGAVYSNDGNLTIKEGKGLAYPFGSSFSPRIFNGSIDYCLQSGVGITETETFKAVLYPNPFSDEATFRISSTRHSDLTLYVYDVTGKVVREITAINSNEIKIRKNELSRGLYFYSFKNGNTQLQTGKMIID